MKIILALGLVLLLLITGTARAFTYRADANVWRADRPALTGASGGDGRGDGRGEASTTWAFDPNVEVSANGQELWPDIVRFKNDKLCAAWMDDRTGTYHIYSAVSNDGGQTWLADERVDDAPSGTMARFVVLSPLGSSDICAVWEDVRSGTVWNVYFSHGVWNGVSNRIDWSPSVRVNTTGGTTDSGSYMHPNVAVDGTRVLVAWTDWREGVYYQVYSRSSIDSGVTWGPERRISDKIGYEPVAGDPCLTVDPYTGGSPHPVVCVWNDWRGNVPSGRYPNVGFARSTDGGITWTTNVLVNDVTDYYQQVSMHVAAVPSAGTVVVGWYNDDGVGQPEMRVSRSLDNGATWLASHAVTSILTGCGTTVALVPGIGTDILASWMGYGSDWNVYFRGSDDAAATWSAIVRADDDATGGASYSPNIGTHPDGSPVIAMQDSRPGYGVYHTWVAPGYVQGDAGVENPNGEADGVLRIAPNPARGETGIHWSLPAAGRDQLSIVDSNGRLVYRRGVSGTGGIAWGSVPGGVYFITLTGGPRVYREKAILVP